MRHAHCFTFIGAAKHLSRPTHTTVVSSWRGTDGGQDRSSDNNNVFEDPVSWVTDVKQLEVMDNELLRGGLRARGLSVEGSKVKLVLRLGEAMGLFPAPLPKREKKKPRSGPRDLLRTPIPVQDFDESRNLPADGADVKLRTFVDGLFRRDVRYRRGDGQEADAYLVSTKRALRSWEPKVNEAAKGVGGYDSTMKKPMPPPRTYSSTAETHAIVMLSDEYGWTSKATRAAADEIAYICDCIVFVPDIYRGNPWHADKVIPGVPVLNQAVDADMGKEAAALKEAEEYEEWRNEHTVESVTSDAEAALQYLRRAYNPANVGIVGFGYGGGKALELASINTVSAPPSVVVAFYPSHFNVQTSGECARCPILAIYGGMDNTQGATKKDAVIMKTALIKNELVTDFIIKLFPQEHHGFAHAHLGGGGGLGSAGAGAKVEVEASDSMLLATAWLDIYLQANSKTSGRAAKGTHSMWE